MSVSLKKSEFSNLRAWRYASFVYQLPFMDVWFVLFMFGAPCLFLTSLFPVWTQHALSFKTLGFCLQIPLFLGLRWSLRNARVLCLVIFLERPHASVYTTLLSGRYARKHLCNFASNATKSWNKFSNKPFVICASLFDDLTFGAARRTSFERFLSQRIFSWR